MEISIWKSDYKLVLIGLCSFIWFLSFKPSEPYLSEFLICNELTESENCQYNYLTSQDCSTSASCVWLASTSTCSILPCSNYTLSDCASVSSPSYAYCSLTYKCIDTYCYKQFTEDQVNNDIYPWSTYAYLPFLCILGPLAEIYCKRNFILTMVFNRIHLNSLSSRHTCWNFWSGYNSIFANIWRNSFGYAAHASGVRDGNGC